MQARSAYQRQVHLVHDVDDDAVGHGGGPARDVLVAQQHDGHGCDPWMEGFGERLTPGDGAPQNRQPGAASGVDGLFPQLIKLLAMPDRLRELLPQIPPRINDFLGKAVAVVRARFGGKVTYASMPFEGVDSAFVYTFAAYQLPHRGDGDPRDDLGMASYGVVKVLAGRLGHTHPGMAWEPKAAFTTLADYYRGCASPIVAGR